MAINPADGTLEYTREGKLHAIDLYSEESFEILSKLWLSVGWSRKYSYGFSWLGRPIIQLPEDLLRYQEAIVEMRPDVIIETGIAHGGSLVFCASLLELLGKGKVIGVDIVIRPHNRKAIEAHPLFHRIRMIEGSSIDPVICEQVAREVGTAQRVMVMLDSCHTTEHVLGELRAYSRFVSVGAYLLVADGLMPFVARVPGAHAWFVESNPLKAIDQFLTENPSFERVDPPQQFNESKLTGCLTYWPQGWLRRTE